ncbi:ATP-binding protein [Streptomyces sp. NPDC092296]|uniref:ATP-binding protein n=1 Tax=Streptomyces sp. NPDC092296 TaxID=3366012 RepID=UPI0037FBDC5B
MTPAGSAVSTPLWEELFMGAGPALKADPDVVTCTLIPRYEAVKDARDFTRNSLHRWGLGELFDDVALVASELVTNALRHALKLRAGECDTRIPQQGHLGAGEQLPIRISLVHRAPQVVCAVSDPSSTGPVTRDADYIAESGRGLHLVDSFSRSWGWHPLAGAGKVVWALFEAHPTTLSDNGGGRHRRA